MANISSSLISRILIDRMARSLSDLASPTRSRSNKMPRQLMKERYFCTAYTSAPPATPRLGPWWCPALPCGSQPGFHCGTDMPHDPRPPCLLIGTVRPVRSSASPQCLYWLTACCSPLGAFSTPTILTVRTLCSDYSASIRASRRDVRRDLPPAVTGSSGSRTMRVGVSQSIPSEAPRRLSLACGRTITALAPLGMLPSPPLPSSPRSVL